MTQFTHCRCGAEALHTVNGKVYLKNECPNANDGRGYVYHEFICQQFEKHYGRINWTVLPEDGKFRAYAGQDPSNSLYDTEQAAWDELDLAMWSRSNDWDDDNE